MANLPIHEWSVDFCGKYRQIDYTWMVWEM